MGINEKIVVECNELEKKYGSLPFDKGLPLFRDGWWGIAEKYGMTGPDVFKIWMDWKSEQKNK